MKSKEATNEFIHKGIEFANSLKNIESEAYRRGAGFGYSCGLQDGQRTPDAVEFAEWVKNNYDPCGDGWIKEYTVGPSDTYTTKELYKLFKGE